MFGYNNTSYIHENGLVLMTTSTLFPILINICECRKKCLTHGLIPPRKDINECTCMKGNGIQQVATCLHTTRPTTIGTKCAILKLAISKGSLQHYMMKTKVGCPYQHTNKEGQHKNWQETRNILKQLFTSH